MNEYVPTDRPHKTRRRFRVGVFGFLGSAPLTAGLAGEHLVRAAPVEMPGLLEAGVVDAALVEAIDLPRLGPEFTILASGAWSMARSSLSVRLFARAHPDAITTVYTDDNSRQAGALLRIVWQLEYGREVEVSPYAPEQGDPPADAEAAILVGDRPVADPPLGFDYQIDIVNRWYRHTGLPLPWALWVCRTDAATAELRERMALSAKQGQSCGRALASYVAPDHRWPTDLATREIAIHGQYGICRCTLDALDELTHLARLYGILPADPCRRAQGT